MGESSSLRMHKRSHFKEDRDLSQMIGLLTNFVSNGSKKLLVCLVYVCVYTHIYINAWIHIDR